MIVRSDKMGSSYDEGSINKGGEDIGDGDEDGHHLTNSED
jgi:hypothetical protein